MKSDILVFIDLIHLLFHYLPSFINSVLHYEIQTCLNLHSVIVCLSKKIFSLNFTSLVAQMKVLPNVLIVDCGQQSNCINGLSHAATVACTEKHKSHFFVMNPLPIYSGFSSETSAYRLNWLNILLVCQLYQIQACMHAMAIHEQPMGFQVLLHSHARLCTTPPSFI